MLKWKPRRIKLYDLFILIKCFVKLALHTLPLLALLPPPCLNALFLTETELLFYNHKVTKVICAQCKQPVNR